MVDQLPNLGREAEMLSAMGMSSIEELFQDIPAEIRMTEALPLPPPQSEEEILADARRLLGANVALGDRVSFLGAGLYRNYVPASVFQLINRGEFLTAYTPYQPEVSQGMLQAMWEFQTLISELVGLPVANLSLYDGSTAAAEALTCSVRVHNRKATQKDTVYVSELTPPDRLSVMYNYCQGGGITIKLLRHHSDGTLDLNAVSEATGSCGVYVEQPNPLGILDGGLSQLKEIIGENTALIVAVQPVSLGLIEAPGNYGADIVVGEGQPLGSPITGGGPIYGIFACSKAYLRLMPGRIVGRSIDVDGKVAYCLTLSTREQHIRRHRATSNICTNETLIALMGAMHMALLGPEGLHTLAVRNMTACLLAKQKLSEIGSIAIPHQNNNHFNEFVVELPGSSKDCLAHLDSVGIIGGFDLSAWYPERKNWLLVTFTDQTSATQIELLVAHLAVWASAQGVRA
ncbi:MAG: aminomethyl-transferring glycine dehydrogenase subunit GcvPA [Euryarchaeota archaeon]|jgi:glycine dehydrogenase subunit 1|nr:aminomethyl-transferring glycine dehydrogenase subunit GcvPA [Euryarchaeota archaeon]MBT5844852.1 aminomethyl-transferring glycine dehydrogenase subunit GcvPA [Euryarchaeota archaeon]MBT7262876.1 aminomethyl-transferring glycine dehydrogenase subunit GcvPA [Euryarchaeota archaeon]MBT7638646.1 aminomethyl-transferring glycine dehydrogenase subunit GcvPA [Euryarchaeota archaeon]